MFFDRQYGYNNTSLLILIALRAILLSERSIKASRG